MSCILFDIMKKSQKSIYLSEAQQPLLDYKYFRKQIKLNSQIMVTTDERSNGFSKIYHSYKVR